MKHDIEGITEGVLEKVINFIKEYMEVINLHIAIKLCKKNLCYTIIILHGERATMKIGDLTLPNDHLME